MRTAFLLVALAALPCAAARAAELPPELPQLEQDGEKWFNEAGKTDLSTSDRNEARKKAWINLYRAKEILDRHWEAHPEDQERLVDRITKIGQMVFWIRKESPVGLLEATGVGPGSSNPPKPRDGPDRPSPEKPPAEKPGSAPGDSKGPGGAAPAPATPPPPKPPAGGAVPPSPAVAAPPQTIEQAYAEADGYARKHRADLPGIMQRFHELMARFPDQVANPLYLKAAQRAGEASTKLKDVYRKLRDDDPGSLKNVDSDEVKSTVLTLTRELASQDAAVRERAAKLLAMLGSGEAAYGLGSAFKKEKEAGPLKAMADALVSIGGRKVVQQIHTMRDEDAAAQGLDMLQQLTGRNGVDRRIAIEEVGGFALAKDDAVAGKAVDFLVSVGKEGAFGLVKALDTRSVEIRLKLIPALAATKNVKVVRPLARFLILSDNPNTRKCREAAYEAIKTFGEEGVPYLFAGLRDGSTKLWTGELLFRITGQRYSANRPGDWVEWWKRTHPDWKEEKD
jgi:hypothetical protein